MQTVIPIAPLPAVRRAARALLPPQARVLVACSGGPDSQAMLDHIALLRDDLQLSAVWAVGIDHQLRPGASEELTLARQLAESHHIPFYTRCVDVKRVDNRLAAARKARYAALRRLGRKLGATHLAIGHTATDQVETLLMNLCRGTSLRGAGAIRARHRGLIRPLLSVGRSAVLRWLADRGILYAQDPSNTDARRARAKLRAQVLPALAALNPQFEAHIGAFCVDTQREDAWLKQRAKRLLARLIGPRHSLDCSGLDALRPLWRRRVMALWLCEVGARPTRQAISAVLSVAHASADNGVQGVSVCGADIRCERGRLWRLKATPRRRRANTNPTVADAQGSLSVVSVDVCRTSNVPLGTHGTLQVSTHKAAGELGGCPKVGDGLSIRTQLAGAGAQTVAFDADRLHFELSLRPWQQGDKLRPFGLKGRIKVGDLFTNHKVPRALRSGWPLLMCGDEVLWVIGLRRSAHAPVTATTRRIVTLKVEDHRPGAQDKPSPACNGFF